MEGRLGQADTVYLMIRCDNKVIVRNQRSGTREEDGQRKRMEEDIDAGISIPGPQAPWMEPMCEG